jgi:hypothetical protein
MPGVGKTLFGIRTEDVEQRLYMANYDRNASHLIAQYKGSGGVEYEEFTAMHKQEAQACLDRMDNLMAIAMAGGSGVFLLDNGAAWWDIVKLAKHKDANTRIPREFAEANTYARGFMLNAEKSGLWFLITAPPREIWTGAKTSTGLYEADGWKHQDFHTMAEIWLYTNRKVGADPQPVGSGTMVGELELPANEEPLEFKGKIMLAKRRPTVEGLIMKDPTLAKLLRAMKEIE